MAALTLTCFALHHACLTVLYVAIGACLPDTRLGHLMSESQSARIAFAILCILCLVALVDALSNMLSLAGYGWKRDGLSGWTWRAMVLGQAWFAFVGLRGGLGGLPASLFIASALAAGAIAYIDLLLRKRRCRRGSDRWGGLGA